MKRCAPRRPVRIVEQDEAGATGAATIAARDLTARLPFLPSALAHHYARLDGTRAERLLDGATKRAA